MSEIPILIFFRDEGFYPIEGMTGVPLKKQAKDMAVINPGTLRVEDANGNILWSSQ